MVNNKDNVYIIFGDSIVYGLYDKEYCGWVNRIRKKLEDKANNNFVVNLGVPGQNSSDIKERFENELKNRYNDFDNFILMFAFGIKDAYVLKNNLDFITNYKENMKYIIDISKKYTDNIYFIGLLNPDYNRREEYLLENVDIIDNTLKDICLKNNVGYINIRSLILEDELTDGLHPNDNGHEKIASFILEKISV